MAKVKERKTEKPKVYICSQCGREISGDHVYIKTRRRTELHIHFGCMLVGRREQDES